MNVLSVVNAGKRKHGLNHWLWAVWIGVEQTPDLTPEADRRLRPFSTWNKTTPTSNGLCPSRKEARRAAWAAIRLMSPERPRAYEYGWASQMLWDRQANENLPLFSRCKIGPEKWLWVVYESWNFWESDPVAQGIAATPELAHEEACRRVGDVAQTQNSMAEFFRTKQAATKRSQKAASTSGAATLEFAFNCHPSNSDYDDSTSDWIQPHRIVKKTKKRIYVEREPYREGMALAGDWRDFVVDTFVLDREEFESTGKATGGSRWYNTYYTDPAIYFAERRSMAHRPDCFVRLNVPAGATAEEIKAAYRRLARNTHPDAGGDAEEFKQVQVWYEQAMACVA
jgi:hypothetical protein